MKKHIRTLLLIALGSLVYGIATQFFIFPHGLFLGGTSGIYVILNHFFPTFSSGQFLMFINIGLMALALIILGRGMAVKTLLGSTLTTVFIGMLERMVPQGTPPVASPLLSVLIGSSLISVASAILFYNDSSSGGTDIIALIIQKYSSFRIGTALMIADILIVIVGACVSPIVIAIASVIGLFVKTRGIDAIIALYSKLFKKA